MEIKRLVLGELGTNCYIVYDENSKEAAVFDPADNAEKILNEINSLNLSLKYIIITHAHYDHIAALDKLKSDTEASICAGEEDKAALNDAYISLSVHFGKSAPISKADITINDKSTLMLGGETIRFLHTPGHTKGSICAVFDGFVISGDTLFLESVGRCDFPGGSMQEIVHSIKEKLFLLPDDTTVYPGHGDATSIGHEKMNNPYVW